MATDSVAITPLPPSSGSDYSFESTLIRTVWPDDYLTYEKVIIERHDATASGYQIHSVGEVSLLGCSSHDDVALRLSAAPSRAFTPADSATGPADAIDPLAYGRMEYTCGFKEYGPFRWFQPTVEAGSWVWELSYGTAVKRFVADLEVAGEHELNPYNGAATIYVVKLERAGEQITLPVRVYHSFDRDGGPLGFRDVKLPITLSQMPRPAFQVATLGKGWKSKSGANQSQSSTKGGSVGILSGILKFFKSLFRSIFNFIRRNWLWIAVFVIAVAVFFPAVLPALWGALVSGWTAVTGALAAVGTSYLGLFTGLSFWEGVALAMGTAFILAPDETAEVVTKAASTIGTAAGGLVGGAIGAAAGASGLSTFLWVGLGAGAIVLISRRKKKQEIDQGVQHTELVPGAVK